MIDRGVTEAHVQAVLAIEDRVLRNYWITQSYADLSQALAALLAPDTANWCTFAAWASRTVGENLRGEDLPDWLRDRVTQDDGMMGAVHKTNARHRPLHKVGLVHHLTSDRIMGVVADAFGATALNLSEGNSIVFAEIGRAGAAFVAASGAGATTTPAAARADRCCPPALAPLRSRASTASRPASRSGATPWTPTTSGSGASGSWPGPCSWAPTSRTGCRPRSPPAWTWASTRWSTRVAQDLLKRAGWLRPLVWLVECTLRPIADCVARLWDDVMTEFVGVADTPEGRLRLGHDVPPLPGQPFTPPDLAAPLMPELMALLGRFDHSQGDGQGSGAGNWVELDDRMNFILNLFVSVSPPSADVRSALAGRARGPTRGRHHPPLIRRRGARDRRRP